MSSPFYTIAEYSNLEKIIEVQKAEIKHLKNLLKSKPDHQKIIQLQNQVDSLLKQLLKFKMAGECNTCSGQDDHADSQCVLCEIGTENTHYQLRNK